MKIKTAELTGTALDFTVTMLEMPHLVWGKTIGLHEHSNQIIVPELKSPDCYSPFTGWSQGGPIIEREKITISDALDEWVAGSKGRLTYFGPTPLVAAMRCYVASKLGDEVDIPAELVQSNPI